ncbi:MAG TPA: HAD-IA family hydrolase [Anaerolineales bacterium]|jgi:HAD superfamily hydrolase (TIGR01549 family)|nr:HAD-IA family hydrolase [Anaerolineales bacterium]
MNIKAVFFDMGGTIETFGYTRELRLNTTRIIQQRLIDAGIDQQLTTEQLYDVISKGLSEYKRWSLQTMEELPSARVWAEYIFPDRELDRKKLAEIAEDLAFLIETCFYHRAMRPEVPEVLQAIKQMGLKIGLISNVNSRGQVPTNLKEYGIIDYFDPMVLSSEYGWRKPDPAIFHHAARLANVPASQCIYIGDRVVRDIEGARRAGFGLAIQIRHDFAHGENDQGAVPDAVIDNLTEVLPILQKHRSEEQTYADPRKIRALIFDAGDVLYFRPQRGRYFAAFLKELGLEPDPNYAQQKKAIQQQAYRGQITHEEYREAIVGIYGLTQPHLVERGKQALIDDDGNVAFFEGVPETLHQLKQRGYLLGIVTDTANSISAKLRWFERGGFGNVWDSIISSMDIGTRKPDPKIYQAVLQQLGLPPEQAIFVGHKASELAGARDVGMHTVAFNYDQDASADSYIEKFSDLLNVPGIGVYEQPS